MTPSLLALGEALANEQDVLTQWVDLQLAASTLRQDLLKTHELREHSREFVALLRTALASGDPYAPRSPHWSEVREFLASLSRVRAHHGFSSTETALFVLSLKQPIFDRLRARFEHSPDTMADALWETTLILDALALYTTEVFQTNRAGIINRQQQELLELSTPVVQLWTGLLAVPLVGTLDSARTQIVMENLLQAIVQTSASIAIIDITGVPTVDTLVAQHLLKTVAAARLMGSDCIISGIRPQIAQTIVHLGVDLSEVDTRATLADAFALALRRVGVALGGDRVAQVQATGLVGFPVARA